MNKTNLIKEAESLIAEVDKTHRYSMSKIYGLYNRVFETNEAPQSCASCLIRKVNELKAWIEKQNESNIAIISEAVDLIEKANQIPKKTTRSKRKEAK